MSANGKAAVQISPLKGGLVSVADPHRIKTGILLSRFPIAVVILAFRFVGLFRITAVVPVVAVVVVIMVVVGSSPAPSVTVRETLSGTKARHSRQDGTGQDI